MEPRARPAAERHAAAEARRARRAAVSDPQPVMDAAAAFLAVRPRSVAETRRRLRQLGYPATLCEAVIERLAGVGYLDDLTFARAWVESRDRARPRAAAVLRQELRLKGVAEETIALVLAERPADAWDQLGGRGRVVGDLAAAQRLLKRRSGTLSREHDPVRRRRKAYALLARNGFDPDVCAAAVDAHSSRWLDRSDDV